MDKKFFITDDQLWAMQEAAKKREKERKKKTLLDNLSINVFSRSDNDADVKDSSSSEIETEKDKDKKKEKTKAVEESAKKKGSKKNLLDNVSINVFSRSDNKSSKEEKSEVKVLKTKKTSESEKAKARDHFKSQTKKRLANSDTDNYNFAKSIKESAAKNKKKFVKELENTLVAESIYYPFSEVAKHDNYTNEQIKLGRNIIENFVLETGSYDILKCMREGTVVTSLYADIISNTMHEVLEACHKKSKENKCEDYDSCYVLDKEYADKFVDSLSKATPKTLNNVISLRVSDAVQNFVNKQQDDQNTIKDILNKAKDQIASSKEQKYTEHVETQARHKISKIYRENTNLYGRMVKNFSKEITEDQVLKESGYVRDNNSLNMAKIMNDTQIMYTVLETINTMGFYNIDKEYVKSIVN